MLKIKLLLLLCMSFSSLANFTSEQKLELEKQIYKTELFLKKVIVSDLAIMSPEVGSLVSVSIGVDEKKIYNSIGGLDDKWDTVKKMKLPGLFLNSGDQENLKEVRTITEDNILASLKELKIRAVVNSDNVDLEKLKELVKSIVISNYSRIDQVELSIETKYSENVVEGTSNDSSSKIFDSVPYVLVTIFFGGLIFFVSKKIRESLDGLNEAITKKDLTGSLSLKSNSSKKQVENDDMKAISSDRHNKAIDQYYIVLDKIKESIPSYYEVISDMILFNLNLKEYEKLVVLFEAISKEEKGKVYAILPEAGVKKFKDFLVFSGDQLYRNGDILLNSAQDIVKMLSLSTINRENFYSYYLKEMASSLDVKQISTVIDVLTINELMFFVEFVDKASLGFAIASSDFDAAKLSADFRELSQEEIKDCVDKVSNVLTVDSSKNNFDPRESILPYLTSDIEAIVMKKLNISKENSFDSLVKKNLKKVISFVKEVEYEEMTWTLSLFEESLRDEVILALPDILGERLLRETYTLTKESLVMKSLLKNHLVNYRKELTNTESSL